MGIVNTEIQAKAKEILESFNRTGNTEILDLRSSEKQMEVEQLFSIYKEELRLQNDDLRKSNKELTILRDRFIHLFNMSPVALMITDNNGTIKKINQAFLELTNCKSQEQLREDTFFRFIQEDRRSEFLNFILSRPEIDTQTSQITSRIVPDSEKETSIPVMITAKVLDLDGETELYFTISDLSSAKYLDVLNYENEYLLTTIEAMGEAFIATNIDKELEYINGNALEILGIDSDQISLRSGRPGADESLNLEDIFNGPISHLNEDLSALINQAINRGKVVVNRTKLKVDQKSIDIKLTVAVIQSNGRHLGYTILFDDITESLRTQNQIIKHQQLSYLGKLAGKLSHEINNKLTVIQGNLDSLKMEQGEKMEESIKFKFNQINDAISETSTIASKLLTFADGDREITQELDVEKILHQLIKTGNFDEKFDIELNLSEDLFPILGKEGQIYQVLLNILQNSIDQMSKGGKIEITTSNIKTQDASPIDNNEPCVKVSIRDYGGGIDKNITDVMFDPYFTTKEDHIGLGLSIVASILNDHNGALSYDNKADGVQFDIFLPAILH